MKLFLTDWLLIMVFNFNLLFMSSIVFLMDGYTYENSSRNNLANSFKIPKLFGC